MGPKSLCLTFGTHFINIILYFGEFAINIKNVSYFSSKVHLPVIRLEAVPMSASNSPGSAVH